MVFSAAEPVLPAFGVHGRAQCVRIFAVRMSGDNDFREYCHTISCILL